MRVLNVLGSTGSIGIQTLDLIASLPPSSVKLGALVAGQNVEKLVEQALAFKPQRVAIADDTSYKTLRNALPPEIEVLAGDAGVVEAASTTADWTMAAITGMAGLPATFAAIRASKALAFAAKEILVAASKQMLNEVATHNTTLLPVDSEHNAIFQVFAEHQRDSISAITLTASGGAFRDLPLSALNGVTKAQALAHPNWSMGPKVTIDSATMMNKALEVIEAHYLFDLPVQHIDVLLHPESKVHGLVTYEDGSVLAQLGPSDMHTAIAHTLAWPKRMPSCGQRLDLAALGTLTFKPLDDTRFPAVSMARQCLESGQAACIAFNAANEVAVQSFMNEALPFAQIVPLVKATLGGIDLTQRIETLADVQAFDMLVRTHTEDNKKRIAA